MFTILGFTLTMLFGLVISLLVVPKMFPLERLGVSYVLGLGFQTFAMFIGYIFGFNFSLEFTLLFLIISICILGFIVRRSFLPFIAELNNKVRFGELSEFEKTILIIILCFFAFSIVMTLYWPVGAWDSLVLYDWRAKLFYLTGSMSEGIKRGYFFGVPLLTSLAHTWVYFLGAKQPEFIYSLYFISFIAMFYGSLREFSGRVIALITIFLLVTTPDVLIHSTFSYTNFPFTVYFVMSTIYMYIWMVKGKTGYLQLSALLLGLSTWTRSSEPFWIVNLLILLIYCFYKKNFAQLVFYSVLFFLIRQPWVIFENNNLSYSTTITSKITEGVSALLGKVSIDHLFIVGKFLYVNVFEGLALLLIGFLFVLVQGFKSYLKQKDFWLSLIIIGNLALVIVGTYIFSLTFSDWKIGGSAARMTMFIPPLILYFITISKSVNKTYESWFIKK